LQLPFNDPTSSNITNINIFLVFASNTTTTGAFKPSVKLDEKRIASAPSNDLVSYPWNSFIYEVITLLKLAKANQPALRENLVQQENSSKQSSPAQTKLQDHTNSLQTMAAAANAMQGDSAAGSGRATVPDTSKPQNNDDAMDLDVARLPRYVMKTIGPNGWEVIENAEQWNDMLLRRGQEVWADGIVNMVVELVDIHVPLEELIGGDRQLLVSSGGEAI